jgi:hypothetical protein
MAFFNTGSFLVNVFGCWYGIHEFVVVVELR